MKKAVSFVLIIGFSLAIPYAVYSHEKGHEMGKTKFTKHFHESLFQVTGKGEFSVEVLLDEKEYKIGKNVLGIVIHDKHDEDVEGADINVMVRVAGESAEQPAVVEEKGGGLYTIANVNLQGDVRWELVIKVKKKKIEDTAIFLFPDDMRNRKPAGQYEK
ncbi:MAG: hypothetical protein HY755_02970 [Nitrospirae bacterium]|nr:hypothetical protein [Nitrospirota bacterium]